MKKILAIVGIVIVVLIVVVVMFLGNIIKGAVETVGPKVAGVSVTVDKVKVNPLTGFVNVKGLVVGNPEGFKTESLMELGEFKLDMSLGSLFTDTILIKEILIDAPQITYERGLKTSNIAALQKNLAPDEPQEGEAAAEEKPDKEKGAGKKVIIEDFLFNDGKVNVTFTAMGGKKMVVPLPAIRLQDIGKESDGASPTEVAQELFGAIQKAVVNTVAASGDLAGDALKGAGNMAGDAAGMAGDTVQGVGEAAGDAAKGATDAAKDAAGALKKGLGGLLGGDD